MRLFIASVFTLLLLSGFLGTIVFAFLFFEGMINAMLLVSLVVLLNFLLWLLSPKLSDIIYRYFFKAKWISLEELDRKSPSSARLIRETCRKYRFNIPRLGLVPDKNPNAFTYGSGRWNARIFVTEGIFHYLEDRNIAAVYGHELGHIKNRDFIVMTAASTILQLLYVMYIIGVKSSRGSGRDRGGSYLALVGIVSYVFFWIGQYIVLYLSRIREYYADQFSAEETRDPDSLSVALLRIAYGILTNPDDDKLVNTTKNMGIMNFQAAKGVGLAYYTAHENKDKSLVEKTFLYDLNNPWAYVQELGSTHPLTGKRIRRLSRLSHGLGQRPTFDFEMIGRRHRVNKGKLRENFIKDVSVLVLPYLAAFGFPLAYLFGVVSGSFGLNILQLLSVWLILIGGATFARTVYRYPGKSPERASVIDLMGDVYASPVRGRRVILEGKFIGRGVPGFIFSEDLMLQDKTGLMYMNYQSWIPVLGNLFFAMSKLKDLIGTRSTAEGWFLRGISSRIDLGSMVSQGRTIKSYIKALGMFWSAIFVILGLLISLLWLPAF